MVTLQTYNVHAKLALLNAESDSKYIQEMQSFLRKLLENIK
jgi:hypothetical protein